MLGPQTSPEQAEREARASGFEPLIPYPGLVTDPWLVRCLTCGHERETMLTRIRLGRRCAHTAWAPGKAVAAVKDAGFQPQAPYPGRNAARWPLVCRTCSRSWKRSLSQLLDGFRCPCAIQAAEAEAELCAAGYKPLVPYPGSARAPWSSVCVSCKQPRRPSLTTIRSGKRCLHSPPP